MSEQAYIQGLLEELGRNVKLPPSKLYPCHRCERLVFISDVSAKALKEFVPVCGPCADIVLVNEEPDILPETLEEVSAILGIT